MDVSGAVVNPAFRATPWKAEKAENSSRGAARIVFVSESNICRSTLAASIMTQMLREGGLADEVEVESRVSHFFSSERLGEAAPLLTATYCAPFYHDTCVGTLVVKQLDQKKQRDKAHWTGQRPSCC